ncbi:vacuolar DHA amino acid exporter [Suillus subluteus]|nr:vacuolar DHA amino acid exporter [Suillus subluteus]
MQGNFPIIWSAISEIKGRKALFTLGSAIVAVSNTIGLMIGMRILQGAGSSAVIAIGAATLADIYEPHQRGTMMGVYYSAPLLGPSLGPIIGGALTQGLGWRAIFWFLVIWGGMIFSAFLFLFKDTFRKERSTTYQSQQSSEAKDEPRKISEKESQVNDEKQMGSKDVGAQTSPKDIEGQPTAIPASAIREVKLNNFAILIPSGLIFAFSNGVAYTCARTLSMYYNYDAMKTGLVLLAFGIGSVAGSILGGRWSDRTLARLKAANGGEQLSRGDSLSSAHTKVAMVWLPLSVIGYAWVCQERVNVAAICVMLFLAGFSSIWIYTSTLAYIVDANTGRSSTAVAANSSFRGLFAFVAVEIAVPLQDSIGDGGLYTLWAGLLVIANCLILLVLYKGRKWREASVEREKQKLDGK